MPFHRVAFVLLLCGTLLVSCRKHRLPPPTPAIALPAPATQPTGKLSPRPQDLPNPVAPPPPAPAPRIEEPKAETPDEIETPKPRGRKRSGNVKVTPQAPPAAPAKAPEPPPQLGSFLTGDQQRELNQAIDQTLGRVRQNLGLAARRQLDARQRATVEQAESLARQAQELRTADLAGAKSLADRAEILTREFLAN